MKITCPSCAAEYNVPGVVAAGRIVRCAKCATEWTPVPPPLAVAIPAQPAAPPPQIPSSEPSAAAPLERLALQTTPPVQPRRGRALLLAWVGSGLVVVAAAASAVVFRAPVMQAWPPSQRVYGVLGLRGAAAPHAEGAVSPHGEAGAPPQHNEAGAAPHGPASTPPLPHAQEAAPSSQIHGNVAE